MYYIIFTIIVFLILLSTICKNAPILASTRNEMDYITLKIKHPNVFFIQ